MRAGLVSSAALHVGIIGFMLVSFSSARPLDAMQESMPIDIVSDAELSQMMAGKKDAPKAEKPKPVVEKVAPTPKPAEQLDAKVDDKKPEVKAANEPVAPPPPPPAEAKPEPKPPAAAQATPQPAPPKDAESLAAKPPEAPKDEPKPDQQAQAKPAPAPPKKPKDIPPKVVQQPPKDQQEFKPNEIAALLDKRTATRQASIGDTINNTAALGASVGTAATLSQTEIDALRARLMQLWNPPAGAANPEELIVTIRIRLNQDGTLSGPPMVVTSGSSPFFMTARDSAIRAIFRGQPFNMLNPAKYEAWKDIEVTFDPREMVRG
ncbi:MULTISPECIES: cell envelope biogenesis protein TolA [unclassified Ancylobacter]|uniref:cell envelope biogenesis protein TolA n=1 Tax=unclassified Ancylobacter TaxID=2626613 RepID=UPI0022710F12|nr:MULTISPECIES: cell envelope biogenesis protein TolA [unclassified Ancylobacter]WAC28931.1 cell envelope biogenesis protein TolA [Ancylobacter sp. SL191]WGD28688.1 cell envelope biogenesis protein TolA [Ancylobacter sp. WKF20]